MLTRHFIINTVLKLNLTMDLGSWLVLTPQSSCGKEIPKTSHIKIFTYTLFSKPNVASNTCFLAKRSGTCCGLLLLYSIYLKVCVTHFCIPFCSLHLEWYTVEWLFKLQLEPDWPFSSVSTRCFHPQNCCPVDAFHFSQHYV